MILVCCEVLLSAEETLCTHRFFILLVPHTSVAPHLLPHERAVAFTSIEERVFKASSLPSLTILKPPCTSWYSTITCVYKLCRSRLTTRPLHHDAQIERWRDSRAIKCQGIVYCSMNEAVGSAPLSRHDGTCVHPTLHVPTDRKLKYLRDHNTFVAKVSYQHFLGHV